MFMKPLRDIPAKKGSKPVRRVSGSLSLPEQVRYRVGNENKTLDLSSYETWTAEEVTTYVETLGVPIGNAFCQHKITGDILYRLAERHYEAMGISCVGDILRLEEMVEYLKFQKKLKQSNDVLWESEEYRKNSCIELCICNWALCCFACRPKTDHYKLTSTTLHIKSKTPVNCCFCCEIEGAIAACIRGCCGTQWNTNSTELNVIRDIDVIETNVNCCDACCRISGTEKVLISTSLVGEDQTNLRLTLRQGDGTAMAKILRDTINESISSRHIAPATI